MGQLGRALMSPWTALELAALICPFVEVVVAPSISRSSVEVNQVVIIFLMGLRSFVEAQVRRGPSTAALDHQYADRWQWSRADGLAPKQAREKVCH